MDSSAPRDRISNLPEAVLVMIISCLPFKDCVRTSGVSRAWRHLYRETRNVAFRQSDFVSPDVYDQPKLYAKAMVAFVDCMGRWARTNDHYPIDSFELYIHDTKVVLDVIIQEMIAFAVQKRVKKLVLDFSDPDWEDSADVDHTLDLVVEVPESIYNLTTLESLSIFACKDFEPSRFSNPGNFKSLSFAWMSLEDLEPLLSKSSRLDSLTIIGCDLDFNNLEGNMREFVIEKSDLCFTCYFNLPNLEIFRYSGYIVSLEFERMNTVMKEVYLDFCAVIGEGDKLEDPTDLEVRTLCDNLNHLPSSTSLTISFFAFQAIQKSEHPFFKKKKSEHPHLLHQVKTKNLVLETELHPKEFTGIWLLLKSCTHLETLTFDMIPPSSMIKDYTYAGINSLTSWMKDIAISYLRKTVKVLVVKDFVGGPNELNLLEDLIQSASEREALLKRIEIYMAYGLDDSQNKFAYAGAEMLQQSSKRVQVLVD